MVSGDLRFGLCTDGISPFNSSAISLWPFYLMNFCLPPDMRATPLNMIVVLLWFGAGKPRNIDLLIDIIIEVSFGSLLTAGMFKSLR
jgi:hypothetical protein